MHVRGSRRAVLSSPRGTKEEEEEQKKPPLGSNPLAIALIVAQYLLCEIDYIEYQQDWAQVS